MKSPSRFQCSRIASPSSLGSTRITLQFDLDREINGAARDVQAALATRGMRRHRRKEPGHITLETYW